MRKRRLNSLKTALSVTLKKRNEVAKARSLEHTPVKNPWPKFWQHVYRMLEPPYYFNIVFAINILHVMDINKHGGPAFREMDMMRH